MECLCGLALVDTIRKTVDNILNTCAKKKEDCLIPLILHVFLLLKRSYMKKLETVSEYFSID